MRESAEQLDLEAHCFVCYVFQMETRQDISPETKSNARQTRQTVKQIMSQTQRQQHTA